MGNYELIDHTADMAIKAYGGSLEEAFATAAQAMFDIITDNSPVKPHEQVRLRVESIDIEGLLVTFLSELILLNEVDGWVLSDFRVTFGENNSLSATGLGEKFVVEKHGHGIQVKGVSYHMMEIVDSTPESQAYVQVLFDI